MGNYRIYLRFANPRLIFILCLILASFPFNAYADVLFGKSYHESIHTSQKDMSELYGISDNTISSALLELEEKGIIEVTRDKPTPPDFADRKANIYRMLPLPRQ